MSKIKNLISRLSSVALLIATMLPLTALAETPVSAASQTMQKFYDSMCADMSTGDSVTLTDSRDDEEYTVRKLADDKCWMAQNLRLGKENETITLTPADSNVSSNWTLPATNSSFPTSCTDAAYNMSSGNTSYGNYYNWYAATAGTGTCAMASGNATDSICPKGWRLPTGVSYSGEFARLSVRYGSSATNLLSETGPALVLSGYRSRSSTSDQGDYGYYWSSTVLSDSYARSLYLGSSSVNTSYGVNKQRGSSVRCLLDNPTPPTPGESTITANVDEVISLRLVSTGSLNDKTLTCRSEADPNCSGEEQLVNTTLLPSQDDKTSMYTEAYVSTNSLAGYTLVLSDSDTTNALTTASTEDTIAAINREPVGGTYPGWAIAIDDDDANWAGSWYQVPISTAAALPLKTSSNPGAVTINARTKVTYGVASSSSQAPGTYTDTVVYTATAL